MSWSFQIFKIFGIPVRIHLLFLMLLVFVFLSPGDIYGVNRWEAVLFIIALFACVVVHELAHSLMARKYGIPVRYIILLPIGGVSVMERMPDDPQEELEVALVGPLSSIVLAGLFGVLAYVLAGDLAALRNVAASGLTAFLARLMWINLILAGFNLIPAFPVDGGRVLRALLAFHMDYADATHTAAVIGQGFAILLGFIGLFHNWWLILIAIFVYMGASAEDTQVRVRHILREVPAWQAMVREFRTLDINDTLADAFAYASHSFQHDFPVLQAGRLVGMITRQGLISGMQTEGGHTTVGAVMIADPCQVGPNDSLADVFQQISSGNCPIAAVVDNGQLVGLITPESVNQYLLALAYQRRPQT